MKIMTRSKRIESKLLEVVPKYFEIYNESSKHHVAEGSETHFKMIIVSPVFDGLTKIERHRLIHKLLADELQNGLHALTLHLFTEKEWESKSNIDRSSPNCRGGYDN